MRVILLKPLFFSGDGEILKTLSSQLSAIFHAAPPIQYKRSLLLVASAKVPPDENQEKAIAFLDELAESNHLQVGVRTCPGSTGRPGRRWLWPSA